MKRLIQLLILIFVFAFALSHFAFGAEPAASEGFFVELSAKFPWIMAALTLIGTLRFFVKPIITLLEKMIAATPSLKDDAWLKKVEASTAWRWFLYILDWLCSVKMPGTNTNPLLK